MYGSNVRNVKCVTSRWNCTDPVLDPESARKISQRLIYPPIRLPETLFQFCPQLIVGKRASQMKKKMYLSEMQPPRLTFILQTFLLASPTFPTTPAASNLDIFEEMENLIFDKTQLRELTLKHSSAVYSNVSQQSKKV